MLQEGPFRQGFLGTCFVQKCKEITFLGPSSTAACACQLGGWTFPRGAGGWWQQQTYVCLPLYTLPAWTGVPSRRATPYAELLWKEQNLQAAGILTAWTMV